MTRDEWESICAGCGKCCLFKIEDKDTGAVRYTDACCHLLDPQTCRCTHYEGRGKIVSTCKVLTPDRVKTFTWLPKTCAYRLLQEGKALPWWHPLVSGNPDLVHHSGHSIKGKVISKQGINPFQLHRHFIAWVD